MKYTQSNKYVGEKLNDKWKKSKVADEKADQAEISVAVQVWINIDHQVKYSYAHYWWYEYYFQEHFIQ